MFAMRSCEVAAAAARPPPPPSAAPGRRCPTAVRLVAALRRDASAWLSAGRALRWPVAAVPCRLLSGRSLLRHVAAAASPAAVAPLAASGLTLRAVGPAAVPTSAAAAARRRRSLSERREDLGRRPEPQRRVRHAQHVRAPRDLDVDVRRHARLQLQLGVRHVDDRRVGHDVLHDRRLQADLRDAADELLGRIGVDAEAHGLSGPDAADVGFVEVGDAPASSSGRRRGRTASAPTCWPRPSGRRRRCAR